MKIVLQRVKKAKCTVDGKITGAIERGYLLSYTHLMPAKKSKSSQENCQFTSF